jgi:hypothetical protein
MTLIEVPIVTEEYDFKQIFTSRNEGTCIFRTDNNVGVLISAGYFRKLVLL